MDKKNKIFFIIFFLLIAVSVGVTYYRIMIKKDYIISAQADCDPYTEKCFIWECDPESTVEGEACTGDPESDVWYYQIIKRKAYNIPLCNPSDENCEALVCPEGEEDCTVTFCDEINKEEQGVECNDPVQYTIDNPEEEETECEEGDEECLAAEEEGEETEEASGEEAVEEGSAGEEPAAEESEGTEESPEEAAVENQVPVVNSIFPVR